MTLELSLSVTLLNLPPGFPTDQRNGDKEFVIRRAATNRVLNVLRHWVSKHSQVHFNLFLLFVASFHPSVSFEKEKTNSCNDSACCSSGLWAEHRAEDAGNWLPGGGDAWPRAPDTGKKGSCEYYQVGFPGIWQMYLSKKKKVSATVLMMPTIEVFVNDNFRTGGSCQELSWPKFMKLQFRGATERKHSSPFFMSNIDNFIRNGDLLWVL